jgi:hypothetical protein
MDCQCKFPTHVVFVKALKAVIALCHTGDVCTVCVHVPAACITSELLPRTNSAREVSCVLCGVPGYQITLLAFLTAHD